ncbi:MAG: hypothetical protein II238_01245 [Alphaproteobacteria bacterium]|nr:hypothetical protein [Alphaproteobacteria bacterium]
MERLGIIKKLKSDYCEHRRLYDHKVAKNTQVAKIDYIIHLYADITNREYIKSLKILENFYFNYLGEQKNGK